MFTYTKQVSNNLPVCLKSWWSYHLSFREANALAAEAREELEDPKNPIVQQFFQPQEGPKMSFLQLFLGRHHLFPQVFIGNPKNVPAAFCGSALWVEGIRPLKMDGSASDGISGAFWCVKWLLVSRVDLSEISFFQGHYRPHFNRPHGPNLVMFATCDRGLRSWFWDWNFREIEIFHHTNYVLINKKKVTSQ